MMQWAWPLVRLFIHLRRGRMPPARLPDPLWYFAFGSNMSDSLFRERRHMTPIESRVGRLAGVNVLFELLTVIIRAVALPAYQELLLSSLTK